MKSQTIRKALEAYLHDELKVVLSTRAFNATLQAVEVYVQDRRSLACRRCRSFQAEAIRRIVGYAAQGQGHGLLRNWYQVMQGLLAKMPHPQERKRERRRKS